MADDDAKAPGGEYGVERTAVEPSHDNDLGHRTEKAAGGERDERRGNRRQAKMRGDERRIGAHRHEGAVREVDDFHHPEHDQET